MANVSLALHEDFVEQVLADPFFDCPYPKSLGRNAFAFANIGLPDFTVADGAATLSALIAASVARIVRICQNHRAHGSSREVARVIPR